MKIEFPFISHSGERKFEYNKIDENILIGTNLCCVTHFNKKLINEGVTVDISLQEEQLDNPIGAKVFCWLPTKDHTAPMKQQLQSGVDLITSVVKQGEKVYVHCKNGHGRAPTLVAAYYISTGMKVEVAVQKIQKRRPTIHLEGNQLEALQEFYNRIKK